MVRAFQTATLLAITSLVQAVVVEPVFKSTDDNATIFGTSQYAPTILIDPKDWPGVIRAAQDLGSDLGRVLGEPGQVSQVTHSNVSWHHYPIVVGTVGKSDLIDTLVASHKLDISAIQGKWESYIQQLVKSPFPGSPDALVIAGSDKRGTIYGIYDVSEQIGVSPWYWWADVPVSPKPTLYLENNASKTQGPPSVKYRGIFLNDEAPCLSSWVTANYGSITPYGEPGFNAKFYAKLFELLLRLKANYLWPAMWNNMFYVDDVNNGPTADLYGIVMGTSHTEPMARATNEEHHFLNGSWDWSYNQANVKEFMEAGVERAKDWETLWTMGMRGSGDTASPTLNSTKLEEILAWQDNLLNTTFGSDTTSQPRLWAIYKEVGGYFQSGMNITDDITLVWTDDNVGNILRLPLANETSRSGGAGVYYHFDYVGSPRNYKWINTIQLSKTWQQMYLAYQKEAREVWVANVGDLKALELPVHHFLSMAYDMSKFSAPESTDDWVQAWAAQNFGAAVADETAAIIATYGMLIVQRKYELLDTMPYSYSVTAYDEAEGVLAGWTELLAKTQGVYDSLPVSTRPSFFEMVLHPVLAGKTVQEIYIKAALNAKYATQKRTSTNSMASQVMSAFAADASISSRYNSLLSGKWNHFMDQVHIGYTTWSDPTTNSPPPLTYISDTNVTSIPILGVGIQGSTSTAAKTLLPVDQYMPEGLTRYIDLFTRQNGTTNYHITSNETYVSIDPSSGTLSSSSTSDVRAHLTVNWTSAPAGWNYANISITGSGATASLILPIHKASPPSNFTGFVESAGAIAIEAEHYKSASSSHTASYSVIPNFGRTLSGVTLMPVTAASQSTASGPALDYQFYTFSNATSASIYFYFGSALNTSPDRPMKFAFSLDDNAFSEVQPVPDTILGNHPTGWTAAVETGSWTVQERVSINAGVHNLKVWLLEPGLVLQKIVIDLGGLQSSYLGPPESVQIENGAGPQKQQ